MSSHTPADVHSLPTSSVAEGRLSRSTIRPIPRDLINYLLSCRRLDLTIVIDIGLINCIVVVDPLIFFSRYSNDCLMHDFANFRLK